MSDFSQISYTVDSNVATLTLSRPEKLNAFTPRMMHEIIAAFDLADADDSVRAVIVTGEGRAFCAGADLKAMREPGAPRASRVEPDGDGPVGPTRMLLTKPVIAAVEGHAAAGGLEIAVWCDLRVAAEDAVFGVFCRRWGIPLMDGGTIRLARLIGHSRALDMILTGRGVSGREALEMGLANRVVPSGKALEEAIALAHEIAGKPQAALRSDRSSSYEQWSMTLDEALANEYRHGMATLETGELFGGLEDYESGGWREAR